MFAVPLLFIKFAWTNTSKQNFIPNRGTHVHVIIYSQICLLVVVIIYCFCVHATRDSLKLTLKTVCHVQWLTVLQSAVCVSVSDGLHVSYIFNPKNEI